MKELSGISSKRRGNVTKTPAFFQYCVERATPHCPFIPKSAAQGLLYSSSYSFGELQSWSVAADAAESLFFVTLDHVELFRRERAELTPIERVFICDNVIIEEPTEKDSSFLRQLIGWPHWILKCLYSSKGIMFGKFWKGELLTTERGANLHPPVETFISIRTAVLDRDLSFINNSTQIVEMMRNSFDDGDTPLPDKSDVTRILRLNPEERYEQYQLLKAWSERILQSTKPQ